MFEVPTESLLPGMLVVNVRGPLSPKRTVIEVRPDEVHPLAMIVTFDDDPRVKHVVGRSVPWRVYET